MVRAKFRESERHDVSVTIFVPDFSIATMIKKRLSGVLLHITSLPGRFGIGDLGPPAYEFVDFLYASGQSLWSLLPLNDVEKAGFCPYSPISAFASNPLLISPEKLVERRLLQANDLDQYPSLSSEAVDFPEVLRAEWKLLRQAFERFRTRPDSGEQEAFRRFCASKEWLPGYVTYITRLPGKGSVCGDEWQMGKDGTRPDASDELHKQFISFVQFVFFEQWQCLKNYANKKGIYIVGDISYSVAFESCDLWESSQLFEVDSSTGKTKLEAGAPPDQFALQGQSWGMPTYAWSLHKEDGFKWWRMRIAESAVLYDAMRLDHFRGFESSWSIPAGSKSAMDGYFVRGPGKPLLEAVSEAAGSAQVFVEDLGFITEDVHALRESLGLPGISVLQFAFEGERGYPHLPHNCRPNSVIYTETHDLKPVVGWFRDVSLSVRKNIEEYLRVPVTEENVHWEFVCLALSSVAKWALIPVQDLLGLGNEARMNISGEISNDNWRWRLTSMKSLDSIGERLSNLTRVYGRLPAHR